MPARAPLVGGPDYTLVRPQSVAWTYWPVAFNFGDPTVISQTPLPLSGVQLSTGVRMVGELKGSLQLADASVRALNPWGLVLPRKTGIVAVRTAIDPVTGAATSRAYGPYIVWLAPRDPATGRMNITARTVESLWAVRYITGQMTGGVAGDVAWAQTDQQIIARDLLNPVKWSQIPLAPNPWPGWITVDPPTVPTGVLRDLTYQVNSQVNLLTAHQDQSNLASGYEWTTDIRVLSGADPLSANAFRTTFLLGYPRLGAQLALGQQVPRWRYAQDGSGSALTYAYNYDGTAVPNVVWANGKGYGTGQAQTLTTNSSDWTNGFLQTEAQYSNPNISSIGQLQQYGNAQIALANANEQFLSGLTVRGDLPPYFGTYAIGDDLVLAADDQTWPDNPDGSHGVVLTSRIMGWTVTPPEGGNSEQVQFTVAG